MEILMGRYRNISILAVVISLQLVGLAVQIKRRTDNQSTRLIRVWAVGAVTPIEKTIVRSESGVSSIWHDYFYLRGVRQQNRELEQQIQQLQLEQVRLRQDAEQARRLQALLGFKEQFIDRTLAAQVIGASGSEQSRIIYLDKGAADGVAPEMAVISGEGIVGKVIQVFRHTAQVLLINDQSSGVGTILEDSRLQGVLKGKPSGEVVLDKVMAEEEVKVGERVLTSGGDQIFPKGLPVGRIQKVTRGAEFLQVTVKPAAALNHLEEVLVITRKQEREPALGASTTVRAADVLAQRLPSVPDKSPAPNPNKSEREQPATPVTRPDSPAGQPLSKPQVRAAGDEQSPTESGTVAGRDPHPSAVHPTETQAGHIHSSSPEGAPPTAKPTQPVISTTAKPTANPNQVPVPPNPRAGDGPQ
ncbi:MAG: rod shape-determining protein MreC [Acidobacteria bacterium]|nr:rod shape-determining protein MreC [Acidobacteriota bacterium]